ncbi:hypothetical protein LB505_004054 [Fusarium chuoi]|nr:hypothetical protein LB505_004054 [Fusarium chuoi]
MARYQTDSFPMSAFRLEIPCPPSRASSAPMIRSSIEYTIRASARARSRHTRSSVETMTPPLKTLDWPSRTVASVISTPITTSLNRVCEQHPRTSSPIPMIPRPRLVLVHPRRL